MKKYVKIKIRIRISEKDNILEFNQYMNSDKMPYIIYADIESLIKKTDGCANNSENSSITKIDEHILCGYSMLTIWDFDKIGNKHTLYHGEDCMKKFCTSLREHAMNVIKFWEEKNVIANKRRTKIISKCESILYLWKKNLKKSLLMIKIIKKLETIVFLQVKIETQHIVFVI